MMVGSSAVVGWMGKTGQRHIERFYLGGQSSSAVQVDKGELQFSTAAAAAAAGPSVLVENAKIYLAFRLNFSAPVTQQQLIFAIGSATPVNKVLQIHDDKTSILFDFSSGFC